MVRGLNCHFKLSALYIHDPIIQQFSRFKLTLDLECSSFSDFGYLIIQYYLQTSPEMSKQQENVAMDGSQPLHTNDW